MTDCPSSRPDMEGARVFGIVGGMADAPQVSYLRQPVPAADLPPAETAPIRLTRFLRFGGGCVQGDCVHFDGAECRLGAAVARIGAGIAERPGFCALRKSCRWYAERGFAACRGCSRIVTEHPG